MSVTEILVGYVIAFITAIVVLLLPRHKPLPEGASVGLLVLMFIVWVVYMLGALLW